MADKDKRWQGTTHPLHDLQHTKQTKRMHKREEHMGAVAREKMRTHEEVEIQESSNYYISDEDHKLLHSKKKPFNSLSDAKNFANTHNNYVIIHRTDKDGNIVTRQLYSKHSHSYAEKPMLGDASHVKHLKEQMRTHEEVELDEAKSLASGINHLGKTVFDKRNGKTGVVQNSYSDGSHSIKWKGNRNPTTHDWMETKAHIRIATSKDEHKKYMNEEVELDEDRVSNVKKITNKTGHEAAADVLTHHGFTKKGNQWSRGKERISKHIDPNSGKSYYHYKKMSTGRKPPEEDSIHAWNGDKTIGHAANLHYKLSEEVELSESKPVVGSYHHVDEDGAIGRHVVTGVHDGVVYTQNVKTKKKFDTPLKHWKSYSSPIKEETELDESTMTSSDAHKLSDRHVSAAIFHKKNGNIAGYRAHANHANDITDAILRAGRDMPVRSSRLKAKSDKIFSAHPHKSMNEETLNEALNIQQRQKRAIIMRRYKSKIERAREIAQKRVASEGNIKKRAYAQARQIFRRKLAGDRGAEYEKLGPSEKMAIDKMLDNKGKAIKKLALRLIPKVKKAEYERLKSYMKGQSLVNHGAAEGKISEEFNDLFLEYFGASAPGNSGSTGERSQNPIAADKTKQSKGKSKNAQIKILGKFEEEAEQNSSTFKALEKKSEKSGIDLDILGEVYDRGLDAWSESYNVSPTQYAFARVNSFINKGKTYYTDDADLQEGVLSFKEKLDEISYRDSGYRNMLKASQKADRIADQERKRREKIEAKQKQNEEVDLDESNNKPYVKPHYGTVGRPDEQSGWKASNKHGKVQYFGLQFKKAAEKHAGISEESNLDEGENTQMKSEDPCWKGYEMVGKKKKGGKEVPNCVPTNEETDPDRNTKIRRKMQYIERDGTPETPHSNALHPTNPCSAHSKQQRIKKIIVDEQIGNVEPDPKKRLVGTDSLVKAYKKDTPGQSLDESFAMAFDYQGKPTLAPTAAELHMQAKGGFAHHTDVQNVMEVTDIKNKIQAMFETTILEEDKDQLALSFNELSNMVQEAYGIIAKIKASTVERDAWSEAQILKMERYIQSVNAYLDNMYEDVVAADRRPEVVAGHKKIEIDPKTGQQIVINVPAHVRKAPTGKKIIKTGSPNDGIPG